ncbi:c-type cytochrome [Paraglaciecola sp. L3A3]|uniref:c-type cytochrome n=1 Tax=Paraglaciecola sp. L3A3 TaxID=2686358 RepID=UPI00131C3ED2|nr:c-type cytochrome [Paraglaciecola sp. L3A3]
MKMLIVFTCIILISVLGACRYSPDSPIGFSLPKGDLLQGEKVFIHYQCQACHVLDGYEDKALVKEFDTPIPLGGTTSTIKTYAQLVTSVINPSHKLAHRNNSIKEKLTNDDGRSKMRVFNDVMTVQELIDLVTFLQPKYQVKPVNYTTYGVYRML